jgi:hypothetical protein
MRPSTAYANNRQASSRNAGQRRLTSGSGGAAEDAARVMLEQEAARQAKLRHTQEEHRRKERQRLEEAQRKEEESRMAEEEARRQKQEAEEEARNKKASEKEEARRVAREQKAEAEAWAAKKKAEAEKRKERAKVHKDAKKIPPPLHTPPGTAEHEDIISPVIKEKLSFFKRWRGDEHPTSSNPDLAVRPKTSSGGARHDDKLKIKPGGGGIVPQIDAPISAVNHGDRRVRIHSQGTSVLLPVKPTTTPLQLIRTSVTHFTFPVDPRNSLLLESFSKSGLQRPLRMYEHVRDILNSWDSDDQHQFLLEPYDSSTDNKLFAHSAPTVKPQGGAWTMYFSQKRGKWDKRWITLTPDGQVTAAKNESGKDQVNVCNLSDFEIFSLTREGEKKRVKPPKKHCYAIKSMQKSSMFLDETGFIHMFCSSDGRLAQDFYNAVFRWRTWYLVHVMGEGTHGPPKIGDNAAAANSAPLLSANSTSGGHHRRGASQDSQYVLGSFATGLDFDANRFVINYDDRPKPKHTRLPSDAPLAGVISVASGPNGAPSAIEHSKALHARQQSIRHAAPAASSANPAAATSSSLQRTSSTRSTTRGGARPSLDVSRAAVPPSQSSPGLPGIKPLIDLTPQYVAPPQHQRKGRGFKPTVLGPGGLVDSATGLEQPGGIAIPESRDWRGRGNSVSGGGAGFLGRSTSVRSTTKGAAGVTGGRGLLGDIGGNEGFTGGGLLGAASAGAGSNAAR